MRLRSLSSFVALGALVLASSCRSTVKPPTTPMASPASPSPTAAADAWIAPAGDVPRGLNLRLRDGETRAATERPAVAKSEKLSDAEVEHLLARVPSTPDATAVSLPPLREGPKPPPETGDTLLGTFPPLASVTAPQAPAAAATPEPLQVLQWSPRGDVDAPPHVSLTFSQPMIAVSGAMPETGATAVPVKLEPTPPGRWRWIGTRTLLFEPEKRFPGSTTFTVTVPAGTKSMSGAALTAPLVFTFSTPPVRLVYGEPKDATTGLTPWIFLGFDQRIDPLAVLATVKLQSSDDATAYPFALLDAGTIAADPALVALARGAHDDGQDGQWLVIRPRQPLPPSHVFYVTAGPGIPSLEGPNRAADPDIFMFRTYGELAVAEAPCATLPCSLARSYWITFTNPLDAARLRPEMVSVTPAVPGLSVAVDDKRLEIAGTFHAGTTYSVKVAPTLTDTFGQTLGKEQTATIEVAPAPPSLFAPQGLVIVDPAFGKPTLDLFTAQVAKLHVRLLRVTPTDFAAFRAYRNTPDKASVPGVEVVNTSVAVAGAPADLTETTIDLSPALAASGLGHVIAVVEANEVAPLTRRPPARIAWIQVTHLAVDAFVDGSEMVAWVTRLADGAPVAQAELELVPWDMSATTSADGTARLKLGSPTPDARRMLVARSGDDTAFLPPHADYSSPESWAATLGRQELRWYVFDDRHMYRPGEEVHLKGWLRLADMRKGGDIGWTAGLVPVVEYEVVDALHRAIAHDTVRVNPLGGFHIAITLPKTPSLGTATVTLRPRGTDVGNLGLEEHTFEIQEFRRPEFEVTAQAEGTTAVVGGGIDLTVDARYFAGGGLAAAPVVWSLTATPADFTPPNWDRFEFGSQQGSWRFLFEGNADEPQTWSHAAMTNALGKHVLHADFLSANPAAAMALTAEATVTDVNRQTWKAKVPLIVHPASAYVGLRPAKRFFAANEALELDVIGVDLEGNPASNRPVHLSCSRVDWVREGDSFKETLTAAGERDLISGQSPLTVSLPPQEGGTYELTATLRDERGRFSTTSVRLYVSGGKRAPARGVAEEQVVLVPDKDEYRDGEVATILVQAPFAPAQGVLSVRRSGIVTSESFAMTTATTTLRVPIKDAYVPGVEAHVTLAGTTPRADVDDTPVPSGGAGADPTAGKRPAYASGKVDLKVPPLTRTLTVTATPRERLLTPGATATIAVAVKDAAGAPVANAEVAVVVVDEAILALTSVSVPDPLSFFYEARLPGAQDSLARAYVMLGKPKPLPATFVPGLGTIDFEGSGMAGLGIRGTGPLTGGGIGTSRGIAGIGTSGRLGGGGLAYGSGSGLGAGKGKGKDADSDGGESAPPGVPIAARIDFNPLALFAPEVHTDAQGEATVAVKLPDNVTRYRVIAVAVAGERQFGKRESTLTVRLPLMVRPALPRFLSFGDRVELPVVVQNQTDAPAVIEVAVRATNLTLTEGAGRRLTVPANDRVEVRFPAATTGPGMAQVVAAAASASAADAARVSLPVWQPATTEAFTTHGVLDEPREVVRQPIAIPADALASFGGLDVETSSTQLQALTDAYIYLSTYEYACSEQVASRMLSVAALHDVLAAFAAPGLPDKAAIDARMRADIARLVSLQNDDGGFAVWRRGAESWPFHTVHAVHALVRARAAGYDVPADTLSSAEHALRRLSDGLPNGYPKAVGLTIQSYALFVHNLMGTAVADNARGLMAAAGGADKLPLEAVGFLLDLFAEGPSAKAKDAAKDRATLLRLIDNAAHESAGTATFGAGYGDDAYLLLDSGRRADAVILRSLIAASPRSPLIPKLAQGLLGHRTRGRWQSTQENVFALLALDRYFRVFEKVTPSFVARLWLGDSFAGERAFRGRETSRFDVAVPMPTVAAMSSADLVVQKDGAGRLYYRIGMQYAPASLVVPPTDQGFVVERQYEAVDDPADVRQQADGTWKMHAGARVRVRLKVATDARRYHVALVDPLPAGLEVVNPALANTEEVPPDAAAPREPYWWWRSTWYDHENLRDERVEAFTTIMSEGVYDYSYVARATTPGRFVVPPPKAEEMYHPETFGRGAGTRVTVE